jgi:acyl-CoA thioester hydrolase
MISKMPRIHVTPIVVNDDAIDVNGHVNNLAYVRWMQDAATAHSAAQGWALDRYLAAGAGWFVRSHFIEYLRPAFAGETLLLYTWVTGMTARSSPRRYLFAHDQDGSTVARAETLWVFVDFESGRPARIPPEVRDAFPFVPDDDPELVALTRGPRGESVERQGAPPGTPAERTSGPPLNERRAASPGALGVGARARNRTRS